ncbi:MAG TPA: hypothetical protein VFU06_10025 [Longimicrobiales bacterium]|nr:hypothetical protein [Longimicrobiales bacterium]
MHESEGSPFIGELSTRIRAAHEDLARRWLDAVRRHTPSPLTLAATDGTSPSHDHAQQATGGLADLYDALVPHASPVVCGVADFIAAPATAITSESPLGAAALRVARSLHASGVDAISAIDAWRCLADVLIEFVDLTARDRDDIAATAMLEATRRIFHACAVITRATASARMHAMETRLTERETRLAGVRGRLTHDLKNRVGAVIGAGQLLQEEWIGVAERTRFAGMVVENADVVRRVIGELSALARLDDQADPQTERPIDAASSA